MNILLKYFPQLNDQQVLQFQKLGPLYNDWNSKINVISRRDLDSLYERHVLHSLSIAAAFSFESNSKVIDIGTGGGFPGIPLAIFFPEVHFHLVDSIAKKLKVVDEVVKATGLQNISTQQARAGDPLAINGKFNFVVSRAVAPLGDLWQWSKPLLNKSSAIARAGQDSSNRYPLLLSQPALISLKGGNLSQEIKDAGLNPTIIPIKHFFEEDYFEEKVILLASA
jgi:16S rRNA (guanine527-N7)-methyltransferase